MVPGIYFRGAAINPGSAKAKNRESIVALTLRSLTAVVVMGVKNCGATETVVSVVIVVIVCLRNILR